MNVMSSSSVSNLESLFLRAATTASRFVESPNAENTTQLNDILGQIIRSLTIDSTVRFSLHSHNLIALIQYAPAILSANSTAPTTRSKIYQLLFHLSMNNTRLRRYMSSDLELCEPVFHSLKLSISEQLGPQNLIDILRLMQALTYEKCVTLGVWANDLISFLMSEICQEPEPEWMPYCIAILCNLASRSKSVCNRIKKSSSYKPFSRRVMKLLAHDSRIVVVSSLVLIGYLEEKIRDMVYCSKNIHETFQCVFNVLTMGDGDCLMTRHIASDLLRRLVVSDTPTISSVPVITSTGKDIMSYSFFPRCIQQTAELLVALDPRLEESTKIYDLLLAFCSLPQLQSPTCSEILKCPPTENRLTTPIIAIAETASIAVDSVVDEMIPIRALKLLTFLLKEIVDVNDRILVHIASEQIAQLIEVSGKTTIDSGRETATFECKRLTEALRIAEICCMDELRNDVLDVMTAQLCAHIAEFQLVSNPIILQMSRPPVQRTDHIPNWSIHGVAVILQLLKLLAVAKDLSRSHKERYWKLLKDERLIPLLGYAIAYGEAQMVSSALEIYTHCAQHHTFNSRWLGDLVASCSIAKRLQEVASPANTTGSASLTRDRRSLRDSISPQDTDIQSMIKTEDRETMKAIDEILQKVRTNEIQAKDLKTSEMLLTYERKIALMQDRERELEMLVKAKDQALQHNERLRQQYKNGFGRTEQNEEERTLLRKSVEENEKLKEANAMLRIETDAVRRALEERNEALKKELIQIRQECTDLNTEIVEERELVVAARNLSDDLKKKLHLASETALQRQSELDEVIRDKTQLTADIKKLKFDMAEAKKKHDEDMSKLNSDILKQAASLEKLNRESRDMKEQIAQKDNELAMVNEQLTSLKQFGVRTQAELEKAKKVKEDILKLVSDLK
ncbi:hypothetical protein WR25_21391 isoform A [Diploscapter pachys]|uniref:CIP2A N-terminal domain-containing protein n=3 Tax=Diploscapter pachys TaxID=2018661 RepID=A0A2A2JCB1_9BILA|nr:hypothetical protein WR25_21391 isoform A [Diploscapter pachys]